MEVNALSIHRWGLSNPSLITAPLSKAPFEVDSSNKVLLHGYSENYIEAFCATVLNVRSAKLASLDVAMLAVAYAFGTRVVEVRIHSEVSVLKKIVLLHSNLFTA